MGHAPGPADDRARAREDGVRRGRLRQERVRPRLQEPWHLVRFLRRRLRPRAARQELGRAVQEVVDAAGCGGVAVGGPGEQAQGVVAGGEGGGEGARACDVAGAAELGEDDGFEGGAGGWGEVEACEGGAAEEGAEEGESGVAVGGEFAGGVVVGWGSSVWHGCVGW